MAVEDFEIEGTKVRYYDDEDRMILHMRKGTHERETLAEWARLCEPDFTAIDVGAYTGLFSIVAALRGR